MASALFDGLHLLQFGLDFGVGGGAGRNDGFTGLGRGGGSDVVGAGRGARRSVGVAGCATVGAFCPNTFNKSWVLLCFAIVSIVYGYSIVCGYYVFYINQ